MISDIFLTFLAVCMILDIRDRHISNAFISANAIILLSIQGIEWILSDAPERAGFMLLVLVLAWAGGYLLFRFRILGGADTKLLALLFCLLPPGRWGMFALLLLGVSAAAVIVYILSCRNVHRIVGNCRRILGGAVCRLSGLGAEEPDCGNGTTLHRMPFTVVMTAAYLVYHICERAGIVFRMKGGI